MDPPTTNTASMRRFALVLCMFAILPANVLARAETVVPGSVLIAVPTGPAVARNAYLFSDKLDGITGDVIELDSSPSARPFEVRGLTGATGAEDLDAWFYTSLTGNGSPCARVVSNPSMPNGGEAGTMCAGAKFAVVVLFKGADATFELRY